MSDLTLVFLPPCFHHTLYKYMFFLHFSCKLTLLLFCLHSICDLMLEYFSVPVSLLHMSNNNFPLFFLAVHMLPLQLDLLQLYDLLQESLLLRFLHINCISYFFLLLLYMKPILLFSNLSIHVHILEFVHQSEHNSNSNNYLAHSKYPHHIYHNYKNNHNYNFLHSSYCYILNNITNFLQSMFLCLSPSRIYTYFSHNYFLHTE